MVDRSKAPVFWSDAVQLVKTVIAGVLAWVIASEVLDLPQSFLAPWAALLVVHSTVYRTFAQGARQVGAAVAGVLLAWSVGNALGVEAVAVAIVLLVGLVLGAAPWFRGEATTVAATALIVLTAGFSEQNSTLLLRLADTGIGIGVGLLVNFTVWPPLRRRTAIAAMDALDDRVGELLVEMASGLAAGRLAEDLESWLERTQDIDDEVEHAWALVRQASESARLNPRRSAVPLRDPAEWTALLDRIETAVAETRSMLHTLSRRRDLVDVWQPPFRDGYLEVMDRAGRAIAEADQAPIQECLTRLDEVVSEVDSEDATPLWPVYGSLLVNLHNILDAMDEVAAANPLSQPPLPFVRR
jgi:uncharacterized membrane protein YccC